MNNQNPDSQNQSNIEPLPPDLVKTLLENQAKELELKARELALQKQEDDHGFEFGKAAFATKAEDRELQRQHEYKVRRSTYKLVSVIALLITGIVSYAMYSKNPDIAMEIIKAIVYLAGGGLGGYGFAKAGESRPSFDKNKRLISTLPV